MTLTICSHAHLCGKADCPHAEPHEAMDWIHRPCTEPTYCDILKGDTTCRPTTDLRSQYVIVKQKEATT